MASVFSGSSATPVKFDKTLIKDIGSLHWYVRKILNTDGDDLTPTADDFCHMPARMKFSITPTQNKNEVTLENKEKITKSTDTSYELAVSTSQKDVGSLYGFPKIAGTDLLQFLIELNETTIDGKTMYATCMGTFTGLPTVSSDADPEYKISLQKATDAISISLSADGDSGTTFTGAAETTGSVTQASGEFFSIVAI